MINEYILYANNYTNAMIKDDDVIDLFKLDRRAVKNKFMGIVDNMHIVCYNSNIRGTQWASFLFRSRHTGCFTTVSDSLKIDKSFERKLYDCSRLKCYECGQSTAKLADSISQIAGVYQCDICFQVRRIDMLSRDDVELFISDAVITKRFPRWRWSAKI